MSRKIAIAGIGGVGGFYGSKLARAFCNSTDTEVYFFVRGENLKAIREKGLQLQTEAGTFISKPKLASDNPDEFGKLDLIVFCCKSYDLENIAMQFAGNIHSGTFLLPLQNGVNSFSLLQDVLPGCNHLYGCVYIVSKVVGAGIVKQSGSYDALHFGNPALSKEQLEFAAGIFREAGIRATLQDNIERKLWEKFAFLSPIATYTSVYNISIGKILEDEEHSNALKDLMQELILLAKQMKKELHEDTIERNFEMMKKLPYETTSSMQADFANKGRTELETLTGFVFRKGTENNLPMEIYRNLYEKLSLAVKC